MWIIAENVHVVDDDDGGNPRSTAPGLAGWVTRDQGAPGVHGVLWNNGAWGFYTDGELAEDTRPAEL